MTDVLLSAGGSLQASIETSMGTIVVRLFADEAPRTVESFVECASRPLFDGTQFHRVIPNFMIQAGKSAPGVQIVPDEATDRRFDRPGLVAAANTGCEWFITEVATPHLNGRHTIFGEVMKGFEIVPKIARKPASADGVPMDPVVIRHVAIVRGDA